MKMKLNDKLKNLRKEHKFNQQNIADALGINRSTYAFYETGRTVPPIETVVALSKIYNISLDYILGSEEEITLAKVYDDIAAYVDPIAYLKGDEKKIIMHYRLLDEENRKKLIEEIEKDFPFSLKSDKAQKQE